MSRKSEKPAPGHRDRQGMEALRDQFLEWMQVRNYSPDTVENSRKHIIRFLRWATDRGISRPTEVTQPVLERYQAHLFRYRKTNGDPLSFHSQHLHLVSLRSWFSWLTKYNHILFNPAVEIELPKRSKRLPKAILTATEVDQVFNQPDIKQPLGLRDRAILETFYSTGVRCKELVELKLQDIDTTRGVVNVSEGKGKKDRVVPIGDRAVAWIERYVNEVRPRLLIGDGAGDVLFVSAIGKPLVRTWVSTLVKDYMRTAGITKKGSCHLFRHTMATLMHENGADIRIIQAILGHSRLDTTAIYTQVAIKKLKEVHEATHPARSKRRP